MKLKIDEIKVSERIRQEVGDLIQLQESIKEVGLLQPIIVNPNNELLSGYRRLEACRALGWEEIEVKVINTEENVVKNLDIEYHENLGRLNFTDSETIHYGEKREFLLNPPKSEKSFWDILKQIWLFIKSLFTRTKN